MPNAAIALVETDFNDLAENKDIWETDLSLSLFRKKLKTIGKDITAALTTQNADMEKAIADLIASIKAGNAQITASVSSSNADLSAKINDANTSTEEKIKTLADEIKSLKDSVAVIDSNLTILIKNDGTMVTAINDIYKRLNAQETITIVEIVGGGA